MYVTFAYNRKPMFMLRLKNNVKIDIWNHVQIFKKCRIKLKDCNIANKSFQVSLIEHLFLKDFFVLL